MIPEVDVRCPSQVLVYALRPDMMEIDTHVLRGIRPAFFDREFGVAATLRHPEFVGVGKRANRA